MHNQLEQLKSELLIKLENRKPQFLSDDIVDAKRKWSKAVFDEGFSRGPIMPEQHEIDHALRLIEKPVFICGFFRSGTTMMRNLLDNHSELCVVPSETLFYIHFWPRIKELNDSEKLEIVIRDWIERFADPMGLPPYFVLDQMVNNQPSVRFVQMVLGWYQVLKDYNFRSQKVLLTSLVLGYSSVRYPDSLQKWKYWVEKTPQHVLFSTQIRLDYPSAKFILMARKPTKMLKSYKTLALNANRKRRLSIRDWKSIYKNYLASIFLHTKTEICCSLRYEDIYNETDNQLNGLFNWLDITSMHLNPTVSGVYTQPNTSYVSGVKKHELSIADKILLSILSYRFKKAFDY